MRWWKIIKDDEVEKVAGAVTTATPAIINVRYSDAEESDEEDE